ncbi:tetratricopeptide repeat protein [Helicobacter sp. MIT 11-5569]|uniref:tetratricopeptide repeat protein n=1 Tax=Helicobacter sp. MIT 11-5569 TaxID=1548151 RepID=UPI0010FF4066|nr:tetratricopeptide repeat protein [Helicobacter sp. MIT 11-5569]TLD85009.1 tetratricopeptide repeat protein [Helicobacter sp. MIT 11-5569]
MPNAQESTEKTADNNVIQLDDNFNILDDILKKEPESQKPASKFAKLQDYFVKHKKIAVLLAFLFGLLLLAFIFLIGVLLTKEHKAPQQTESAITPPKEFIINQSKELITDAENLEALIKKANFLYTNGNKQEALDLYGKISNYSEVLSNYNLGVAQMEEKAYAEALDSFQKAIDLNEDRVISALNAAVCSLRLEEPLKYRYYLQLAQTYLPYSGNLPLYSYLYSLTNFYLGNYLEAFSSLLHRNSPYYEKESDALLAAMYAYFGNNYKAIEALSKNSTDAHNWFNLALLYARIGDYERANSLMLQSVDAFGSTQETDFALLLIKMKLPEYGQASKLSSKYATNQVALNSNPYPVKITLRDEFFNVDVAQARFWESFTGQKLNAYKILFYYAPYKVFDAEEAFSVIQEGGMNIHIENLQEAKEILVRGQTISRVNRNIANAILETLSGNIRNANALLKKAVETYPNHSILHYNLGLNYAQMNDFDLAYRHFLRAFHLNPSDLNAGLFAMVAARLTYRDTARLEEEIGREIINFNGSAIEQEFIQALLNFVRDGIPNPLESLEKEKSNMAIYYALDFAQGVQMNNQTLLIKSAESLKQISPRDPIANLLALLALNYKDEPKALSLKLQQYYQDKTINKDAFYYGASVVREMYIEMAHIIGTLHYIQQDLDTRLITEQKDVRGVIQALALTYLYLQEFEKSFTLYNSLIDDFKEQDTQTLFLTAVSAVGAGHLENAAALLQLAKLEAPTHYETRIANAIIYLQEKNFNAASVQFGMLGDSKVVSKYFDFKVDTTQILQNP